MDAGHMFKGRGPNNEKCREKGILKVDLDYSKKNKLLEEMRLMIEKDILVKEKIVTPRELLIERHCRDEAIYVISTGEKMSIFLDTPTKIERLSEKQYFKLSLKMKQNIIRAVKVKVDAIKLNRILKSSVENEKKASLLQNTILSYWKKHYQRTPYLRKLFINFIQKSYDINSLSKKSLKLVSERMFLKNLSIMKAAYEQCQLNSHKILCVRHFPFKFEGVSYNFGFSGQESEISSILHQKKNFEAEDFKINNFKEFIKREKFNRVTSIISKEPSFRYLIPPFIKYLQSGAVCCHLKCLHLISLIFSCSYNPFSDPQQPYEVVNYMCHCLLNTSTSNWEGYYICQRIGTIMNKVGNKLFSVQKAILKELIRILTDPSSIYNSCLGIIVAMKSMEYVSVREILFEVFQKMDTFVDVCEMGRYDFYFLLLDVCEIFITKLIERETESTSEIDLCVASKCLNFFKEDLSLRLTPVFGRYKARMFRKMKYNFKKYHKIGGLEDPNTFFQKFIENPPKVNVEKVPEYPRIDYLKCDYSLDCFDPDEKLSGNKKSGGDEVESSDEENSGYVEKLSDDEESCEAASSVYGENSKYFRFLQQLPKHCLDHKNLISSYRKKGEGEDEQPCTDFQKNSGLQKAVDIV